MLEPFFTNHSATASPYSPLRIFCSRAQSHGPLPPRLSRGLTYFAELTYIAPATWRACSRRRHRPRSSSVSCLDSVTDSCRFRERSPAAPRESRLRRRERSTCLVEECGRFASQIPALCTDVIAPSSVAKRREREIEAKCIEPAACSLGSRAALLTFRTLQLQGASDWWALLRNCTLV